MKRSIILLLLLANGAIAAFAAGKPLVITRNGASGYRIVVAVNASANDLNASATLQSYLKRISGAELPVVTEAEKRSGSEIVVGFRTADVPGLSTIGQTSSRRVPHRDTGKTLIFWSVTIKQHLRYYRPA
jgi:hypothetical protein